jgi:hypothetical protein
MSHVRGATTDRFSGLDVSFARGSGLASGDVPVSARTCYWAGWGGSLIMIDQNLDLTISYAMIEMKDRLDDTRGTKFRCGRSSRR